MKKVYYKSNQLSGLIGQENAPVGTIYMYGGTNLPFGYLWCNGATVSRELYADLFNAIGTAFGSGDGSTTFNLPDWRERVPMGASDDYPLGSTGGEAEHTLTVNEMPKHRHYIQTGNTTLDYKNANTNAGSNSGILFGASTSTPNYRTDEKGLDQPHNNLQPYQTCNYIIKFCKAIYPTQEQFIDDSTVSAEKTWSSEKIASSIKTPIYSLTTFRAITSGETLVTFDNRKISDYTLLVFVIGTSNSIRGSTVALSSMFTIDYSVEVTANHNTGLSQVSGATFIYVDDTHIKCNLLGAGALNSVAVYGIR